VVERSRTLFGIADLVRPLLGARAAEARGIHAEGMGSAIEVEIKPEFGSVDDVSEASLAFVSLAARVSPPAPWR